MRVTKVFYATAALMGFFGVLAGAVGAHMIQPGLSDIDANSYNTAVVYLFVHTLALMGVAVVMSRGNDNWPLKIAGSAFLSGNLLFSGTILVRLVFDYRAPMFFAPTGGTLLMLGWLALLVGVLIGND